MLAADDVSRVLAKVRGGQEVCGAITLEVYNGRQVRPKTAARPVTSPRFRNKPGVLYGAGRDGKDLLGRGHGRGRAEGGSHPPHRAGPSGGRGGERLGFLPGDLQAKINPYLRPLFDALRDMMEHDMIRRYTEEDMIEVMPLAYMRGRTLNDSLIILDEAQNTTVAQMKMFLTRMGNGSKILVSGDTTQVDLPPQTHSGLVDALQRLRGFRGVAAVALTNADIVRHRLVQEIVGPMSDLPSGLRVQERS